MPGTEGAATNVQRHEQSADTEPPRPVLFLHVPKTAGTSFLLMLRNVFGDNRVRRIHAVDEHIQQAIDGIAGDGLNRISCLTGHLPLYLFKGCLDRFQPFTVLRDPVSRVLSLFRFLKASDRKNLARLGLPPDFSLEEFLGSRHPELHGQINDGMVRMLCGDERFGNPDYPAFWDKNALMEALQLAVHNLERMDFGMTEDMDSTLAVAQVCWSVGFFAGGSQTLN